MRKSTQLTTRAVGCKRCGEVLQTWEEWSRHEFTECGSPCDNLAYDECVDCRFGMKEEV